MSVVAQASYKRRKQSGHRLHLFPCGTIITRAHSRTTTASQLSGCARLGMALSVTPHWLIPKLSKRDSEGDSPHRRVSDSRWRAREVRHVSNSFPLQKSLARWLPRLVDAAAEMGVVRNCDCQKCGKTRSRAFAPSLSIQAPSHGRPCDDEPRHCRLYAVDQRGPIRLTGIFHRRGDVGANRAGAGLGRMYKPERAATSCANASPNCRRVIRETMGSSEK